MAATIQSNFVPEIWSARFLSRLDDSLVWGRTTNSLYEGEISAAGDTVKIPTPTTTVTVSDYTIDTDIADPTLTSGTTQDLDIDQQKYYHFYVDDIDRAQAKPAIMDDAMGRAARAMAETVDTKIKDLIHATYNSARQATIITQKPSDANWGTNTIKGLAKLKRIMTTAKLPLDNRWLVVDEDFQEGLDIHFGAGTGSAAAVFLPATSEQAVRNGFVGKLLGFDLYVGNSARLPAGAVGNKRAYAGQGTEAVTLARQIVKSEAYRPEKRFGEAVKGLVVYGAKVTLPARLFSLEYKSST